jgi:Vault protein inter-alpha-trypsin domain
MLRFLLLNLVASIWMALTPNPAFAEDVDAKPNPVLMARANGVNDASARSKALTIETMDMRVKLHGRTAETTLTLRFANPSSQSLEGEFVLDMPLGSVVTGYALDIGGAMVDGVLVPPYQARQAYEQRVAQRVDPGIVEVTYGSRFSTRVFPIFPRQGRTIRLSFVTPLDPETGYTLPFGSSVSVGTLKLSIEATGEGEGTTPTVQLPRGVSGKWGEKGLKFEGDDIQLGGALKIQPTTAPKLTVSTHPGEGHFFDIIDSAGAPSAKSTESARGSGVVSGAGTIAILWDRSRSRLDADHAKEVELLTKYLERAGTNTIRLVLFDSGGVEASTHSDDASLRTALKAVRYGGATSFATLTNAALGKADTCLLVSDGLATLDRRDAFDPACRVFAITSSRDADRGFLGARARRSGGDLIDLASTTMDAALARMNRATPTVVSVTDGEGRRIDVATLDGGTNGWRIIGEAPDRGDVIVTIAETGKANITRRYAMPSSAPVFGGPGALWAAHEIGANAADRKPDALLKLARRYSVASPLASFIVLESPQDYAQAQIDPPATYPKAQRAAYDNMKAEADRGRAVRVKNQSAAVARQFAAKRAWWLSPKEAKPTKERRSSGGGDGEIAVEASPAPAGADASVPQEEDRSPRQEIVVTAARRDGRSAPRPITRAQRNNDYPETSSQEEAGGARAQNQPRSKVVLETWNASRPYLDAINASTADPLKAIAAQEKKYGTLPAFYLDVSAWYAEKGQKAEALRMAASALDLPARNNDTLAIVAARLLRLGETDRAIWLLEQLVTLEPDRPQPRRTLALALIQRSQAQKGGAAKADLQRAFDLLAEVVNTPWDGRYPEIELIALNDANAIVSRLTALGGSTRALDDGLLQMLDADIRVVVEWNTKNSDMDLWVDEPDGERVIFNDPRSAKGGYLSRDMTQGFGPEEYFIRKAPDGTYTIRINTFATDRLNPNGPTTVTARLYRNFGRANQSEELIDLEVLPGSEGERRIGRITIGAK